MSLENKNAFQYEAYRPLQWPSGGGGVVSAWGVVPEADWKALTPPPPEPQNNLLFSP